MYFYQYIFHFVHFVPGMVGLWENPQKHNGHEHHIHIRNSLTTDHFASD
uniref:Uncharacterized protein n=1 Tax=Arundo donax TaxID=35708 RepID=A0A0A9ENF4_ARUDO